MTLNVKAVSDKIGDSIPFPYYASDGAAAMDLHACVDETLVINSGSQVMVPTGIAIELPSSDYVALVLARSGTACKHGVAPANCVGVIDSDYRGEVMVCLYNHSDKDFTVNPGDRIAQLMVQPVVVAKINIVNELNDTKRGTGGFGSTGK